VVEALPAEHPLHVFVDLVRSVDLGHFVVPPGPKGEKPYHPPALCGVLAWGYLHGVRSSRKLARLARQEAAFVYLISQSSVTRDLGRWQATEIVQ
jgi:transposase